MEVHRFSQFSLFHVWFALKILTRLTTILNEFNNLLKQQQGLEEKKMVSNKQNLEDFHDENRYACIVRQVQLSVLWKEDQYWVKSTICIFSSKNVTPFLHSWTVSCLSILEKQNNSGAKSNACIASL